MFPEQVPCVCLKRKNQQAPRLFEPIGESGVRRHSARNALNE
jgi:hypothetical protein